MTCQHLTIRALSSDGSCPLCDPQTGDETELEQLDETALLASICRDSFADFVTWAWPLVTGMPYAPNTISTRIITTLQQVADGELTRVLIACPPGVGKSTLLACYSAWRIARNAAHRSIHAGHASTLAETESRRVRRLVEGDEMRRMFAGVQLRADANTAALWETTSNGHYVAVGVDGGLTGKRAIEAVVDDGLNAVDRFSKAARDGLWVFFTEGLTSRLDGDNAPMIVVIQRLDRDDLIGRLIEAGGWHLVKLPAEEPDGTLNAPNVLSREKLDGLKKQMGAAAYACQYLQEPSDDSNALIKRSWWRFHRTSQVAENHPRPMGCQTDIAAVETPTEFDRIVIAVDMTFGGMKTANDPCDAAVWGSKGSARYLLEAWNKKTTQLEQREAIKRLQKKYPYAKVLIEKAAGGAGAIEQLNADGIPNIVAVLTGGKGKDERLGMVSPTIEGGNCYLPLGATWLGDFVEELAGATKHDDRKDTTSYALADLNSGGSLLQRYEEHEQALTISLLRMAGCYDARYTMDGIPIVEKVPERSAEDREHAARVLEELRLQAAAKAEAKAAEQAEADRVRDEASAPWREMARASLADKGKSQ